MVLVNGETDNSISAFDRGLNYGDGLFETMVVVENRIRFFSDHLERLQKGCEKLALNMPAHNTIESDLNKLCAAQKESTFIFKILLTRGSSGRGYLPSKEVATTRVSSSHSFPAELSELQRDGLKVHLCDTRLSLNAALAGIKHTNRLEQVMASLERVDTKYDEGLVLSLDDYVVEGTKSNIFWQSGGEFYTPSIEHCGVAGVTRAKVIEILENANHTVNIGEYRLTDVASADLVFMTNSTMLIAQVRQLGKSTWSAQPLIEKFRQTLAANE